MQAVFAFLALVTEVLAVWLALAVEAWKIVFFVWVVEEVEV